MFKRIPWKTPWPSYVPASQQFTSVYIGLGTNIGNESIRRRTLLMALLRLHALPATRMTAVSSLYQTPAWGVQDQPDFFNAVAAIQTHLRPMVLLKHLKSIEQQLGRKKRLRWGPREIDLDILLYGTLRLETPRLTIPHSHLRQRNFVLVPLKELGHYLQHQKP